MINSNFQSTSLGIEYDLTSSGELKGDGITKYFAVCLYTFFKRNPEYTSLTEKNKLELIMGNSYLASKIEQYIERHPLIGPDKETFPEQEFSSQYIVTAEKCRYLMDFIQTNSFILRARDAQCISSIGVPMIWFPITCTVNDSKIQTIAHVNWAAIQYQVKKAKIELFVVSDTGFSAISSSLQRHISKSPANDRTTLLPQDEGCCCRIV